MNILWPHVFKFLKLTYLSKKPHSPVNEAYSLQTSYANTPYATAQILHKT